MAADGLSLTDDGRVFFNTTDALAPRDLNQRKDAYEWNGETPQLISTGAARSTPACSVPAPTAPTPTSSPVTSLVPQDKNGTLAKIYDAREEGGFPFLPDPVPCKASDECHGAGSAAPGPLPIGTITGNGGNSEPARKCRKGFKRRGDRCVKKQQKPEAAAARGDGADDEHARPVSRGRRPDRGLRRRSRRRLPARLGRTSNPSPRPLSTTLVGRASGHRNVLPRSPNRASRGGAKRRLRSAPRGSSATRARSTSAPRSTSPCTQCPPALPGRPDHGPRELRRRSGQPARHRADLRPRSAATTSRRSSRFIVPTLNIPINDPGHGAHRRPTTACASRSPTSPSWRRWRERRLIFWGFPAEPSPRRAALPQGRPRANPPAARRARTRAASPQPTPGRDPVHPLIDNPTICTGEPLPVELEVQTYQDPRHPSPRRDDLSADHGLLQQDLQAGPLREPDDERGRFAPRASTSSMNAPQPLGSATTPSRAPVGDRHPPRGPDDQPRRRRRAARLHRRRGRTSAPRARPNAPTTPKIGTFAIALGRPRRPPRQGRSTSANRSRATSTGCS